MSCDRGHGGGVETDVICVREINVVARQVANVAHGRGSRSHDEAGGIKMRVLIVYASRYGATQGIAERIAAILRQHGLETTVEPVQRAADPADTTPS